MSSKPWNAVKGLKLAGRVTRSSGCYRKAAWVVCGKWIRRSSIKRSLSPEKMRGALILGVQMEREASRLRRYWGQAGGRTAPDRRCRPRLSPPTLGLPVDMAAAWRPRIQSQKNKRVSTPRDRLLTAGRQKPVEKFFRHSLPEGWSAQEVYITQSSLPTRGPIHNMHRLLNIPFFLPHASYYLLLPLIRM